MTTIDDLFNETGFIYMAEDLRQLIRPVIAEYFKGTGWDEGMDKLIWVSAPNDAQ